MVRTAIKEDRIWGWRLGCASWMCILSVHVCFAASYPASVQPFTAHTGKKLKGTNEKSSATAHRFRATQQVTDRVPNGPPDEPDSSHEPDAREPGCQFACTRRITHQKRDCY